MNRPRSDCPNDEMFAAMLNGVLTDAEAFLVEEHIDTCAACRMLIAELARSAPPPPQSELAGGLDVDPPALLGSNGVDAGRDIPRS